MIFNKKDKPDRIIMRGHAFTNQEFEFLMNSFKESFSQASLSIERAFAELDEATYQLDDNRNELSVGFYSLLSADEQKEIDKVLRQMIVYIGINVACLEEIFPSPGPDFQKQIDDLFKKYYTDFIPYLHFYTVFDSKGEFDKNATYVNLRDKLFLFLRRKQIALNKAYNMKRDNLNAWDYAVSLDHDITIEDTIIINSIVNDTDDNKVIGFKRTNNDIIAAPFTPTDKTLVIPEMQRLYADYDDDFGLTILDPSEENLSAEERTRRCFEIFRREAIFHIRFERIHPFTDGNGRTGRIILNQHLLKAHIPPVIITGVMSDDYRTYINEFDIDGLAKFLMSSSSLLLTSWIGLVKAGFTAKRIKPTNDALAKIGEADRNKLLKRIKDGLPNFLILF